MPVEMWIMHMCEQDACACTCVSVCVCVCVYVHVCGVVIMSLAQGLRSLSSSPTQAIFHLVFPSSSYQQYQSTQL